MKKKLNYKFKNNFLTGLITLLPLFVTFIFFKWMMNFLHKQLNFIPRQIFPDNLLFRAFFEIGLFLIIILFIYLFGILTSKYIGKEFLSFIENLIKKIPLVNSVYSGIKQIIDSLTLKEKKFLNAVLVEYPRKGILSIGFVTGEIVINKNKLLKVFVPSTPNPTTGYLIFCHKKDVKYLNISVETALKLILSGGIISIKEIDVKK